MRKTARPDASLILLATFGPGFWAAYYLYAVPHIDPGWPAAEPLRFALLVLLYPVLEEVVFRGLVLEWLGSRLPRRFGLLSVANLLTSVLFAALHLVHHTILWAGLVFFPSLVFGYAKERYRTLWVPIFLHCWYNLGFI